MLRFSVRFLKWVLNCRLRLLADHLWPLNKLWNDDFFSLFCSVVCTLRLLTQSNYGLSESSFVQVNFIDDFYTL